MKSIFIILLLATNIYAALLGVTNSFTFGNGWKVDYSLEGGYLNIEASGTNKGSVGIGFGGTDMVDIDVALLTVINDKVVVQDMNQIDPPEKSPRKAIQDIEKVSPGKSDFQDTGSTFDPSTGVWKASFKRKQTITDTKYDNQIIDGDQIQVSIASFSSFTWGGHHTFRESKKVKLTSQEENNPSATDNSNTSNGSIDNGSTDNGSTDNGSTDNGSTDNGSTNNESNDNGKIHNQKNENPMSISNHQKIIFSISLFSVFLLYFM